LISSFISVTYQVLEAFQGLASSNDNQQWKSIKQQLKRKGKTMKRLLALLPVKPQAVIFGVALIAGLLSISQTANAATAYYVSATDVYARSKPQAYAMGRLYNHTNTSQGRMDIQYVDSNGWAYGYAYGYVNRCVWAQYSYRRTVCWCCSCTRPASTGQDCRFP